MSSELLPLKMVLLLVGNPYMQCLKLGAYGGSRDAWRLLWDYVEKLPHTFLKEQKPSKRGAHELILELCCRVCRLGYSFGLGLDLKIEA